MTFQFIDECVQRWPTLGGLFTIFAVGLLGLGAFGDTIFSNEKLILAAIYVVGLTALWYFTQRRVAKGKVGIGVALYNEGDEGARRLQTDFVTALRNAFGNAHDEASTDFVEFAPATSRGLHTIEQATKLANRTNLTVLIFGQVRVRVVNGQATNVVDLRCLARHVPITSEMGKRFAHEMTFAMPQRMFIASEAFLETEIAAQHVEAAVHYIVAVTHAFAGHFEEAERLFGLSAASLAQFIARGGELRPGFADRVKKHQESLYAAWIHSLMERWRVSRDVSLLREVDQKVALMRGLNPASYIANNTSALCEFILRGDVAAARRYLTQCEGVQDATWHYNSAFLCAYEGDLDGAYRAYRRAAEIGTDDATVPLQCEQFIHELLEADETNSLNHLYYCLGIINARVKRDMVAAKKDFASFLERTDVAQFAKHHRLVKKWLADMEGGAWEADYTATVGQAAGGNSHG